MKFKLLLIILIIGLGSFAGCSTNLENQMEEPDENEVENYELDDQLEQSEENENDEDKLSEDEPVSSDNEEPLENDIMTDSGTYVGQVDNNHIEIMISGVPEEIAAKVFRLDTEIRDGIEDKISPEDQVIFEYYINEDEVGVITKIEKISN